MSQPDNSVVVHGTIEIQVLDKEGNYMASMSCDLLNEEQLLTFLSSELFFLPAQPEGTYIKIHMK